MDWWKCKGVTHERGEERSSVEQSESGGSGRRIAARPCVNVSAVLAGALSNLLPPTTKQLLRLPLRRDHPLGGPWSPECHGSAPSSRGWEERRGLRPSSSRASWPPPARAMARSGVRDAARRAPGCRWCGVSSRPKTPSWTPSPLASMGPVSTEHPVCLFGVKWLTACDVINADTWTL